MDRNLKEAAPVDAQRLAFMQLKAWRETYSGTLAFEAVSRATLDQRAEYWQSAMRQQGRWIALYELDSTLVGFASVVCNTRNEAELTALYVLADYQGKGIGRNLMEAAKSHVVRKGFGALSTLVLKDSPAQHFYRATGGEPVKTEMTSFLGEQVPVTRYRWALDSMQDTRG